MGGAFSNGQDNDELVDNLVDSGYIRSKKIEQVFRAVDRGDYFLSSHRENAYKDFAWKHGNVHLSAPCIYCEVMEELALKPGLSFLNLGSGTGYLSTMAGLLLTQSGTNHGIELHEDCVRYSYDRLEEFKQKSLALDEFDFCEPVFVQGNCLSVAPGRRYDRVYCGATCPESHVAIIKEFVKVGGILVMPYKDHLVKAKRIHENIWEQETMLPVSFAHLVVPVSNELVSHLPECEPPSLQELCRGKIRRYLRQNVWSEHADLETRKPICLERHQPSPPHRTQRQFVIPIFEESDENQSDDDEATRIHRTRLLLNVDGPPGENLRTTLQLVRAVIHPNREEADDDRVISWPDELEEEEFEEVSPPSTEENTHCYTNSERERHDSESSSDSACEKSHSESNNVDNAGEEKPGVAADLSAYLNMSESDSDQEDVNEESKTGRVTNEQEEEDEEEEQQQQLQHISPAGRRRKQPASRKETADSGIVEDAGPDWLEEEASLSSDSELASAGTPVKHKRSSSCPSSEQPSSKRKGSQLKRLDCLENEPPYTGHYVDTNAFSSYMKEKIHQLPLPYSLKLYINYNRNL